MPSTLLPPPNDVDRKAGWSIAYSFLTAIQSAAQRNRNEPVSLEIVEAVLLAAEATMLQNAGEGAERPVERPADVPEPYRLGQPRRGPAVQQLAPAVTSLPKQPEERISGAKQLWIFIFLGMLFLCGVVFWGMSGTSTPTETGVDGWVSGIESCPTSKEYRQLIVKQATFLRKPNYDGGRFGIIAHSTKIEVLSRGEYFHRVRYNGNVGYVASILVIDYNPLLEFRSDPKSCYGVE